jgi:hypothetical protein
MELGRHEFLVGHFAGALHIIIPRRKLAQQKIS